MQQNYYNDSRWKDSFFIIPNYLPDNSRSDDFIFFDIPDNVDPFSYSVVVEAMNTRGSNFRILAKIQNQIRLPHTYFSSDAKILVIPRTEGLPVYIAKLSRGC